MVLIGQKIVGYFTEPRIGNPNNMSFRFPAINIRLGPDHSSLGEPLVGMVDTGSDMCRIGLELISKYNLVPDGHVTSKNLGSPIPGEMYLASLRSSELNWGLDGKFPIMPCRSAGAQYDLILGMDWIKYFDLEIRPKDSIFEMTYRGA